MEPGRCRCCLSHGLAKDLNATYVWLDKNEVYSDMLRECFNIVLSNSENGSICEDCISQLRSAMHFKLQVLQAEKNFLEKLNTSYSDALPLQVKLELKQESDAESDDYFLADAVRMVAPDVKIEVKHENNLEHRTSKKPVKSKKEPCSQKIRSPVKRLAGSSNSSERSEIALKKKDTKVQLKVSKKESVDIKWTSHAKNVKRKHRENLQTILKYSNVVPFHNKSLLGYICAYCDSPFPDPADLKAHTERTHEKERLELKNNVDMTDFNVKLDVSNLNCTLCDETISDLGILKQHLVKVHDKVIYSDIKDHMLQFKLKKGDVYDCALCSSRYETFKMLKQHMNNHYNNYSCNKCDASFATKRSLNSHKATHLKGSFKCQFCDKVFSSKVKQNYHEKSKHLGARRISNCPHCDEPFSNYYQRNQHLIKVHNAEAQYKCNVCEKEYILKSLLMYHIKKTHLMERNFQCTECGYKFFSKKALTAHMVKHTGERKYACEVCHKCYARKYTLREHMRIHNNDRRFKCEMCTLTFVQKCSLKSHLLSNHGISMAACDITSS